MDPQLPLQSDQVVPGDASVQQPQMPAPVVADQRPAPTVIPQAIPTAVLQQQQQDLNPTFPQPSTVKEQGPVFTVDQSVEMPAGMQSVEELRSPEIPVEVEKYIEEVQDSEHELPQEVVVADQVQADTVPPTLAKPVIVLPMTQDEYRQAKRESVTNSKRWLRTWIEKITKMFFGEVVFQDEQDGKTG